MPTVLYCLAFLAVGKLIFPITMRNMAVVRDGCCCQGSKMYLYDMFGCLTLDGL